MKPVTILKTEEFFVLLLSIYLYSLLALPWYWYAVFFLAPDLSMFGYLAGTAVGATVYNLAHHKALGIILYFIGIILHSPALSATGLVITGHASFDRIMGYGLKYADSFGHTHLGMIGKDRQNMQRP